MRRHPHDARGGRAATRARPLLPPSSRDGLHRGHASEPAGRRDGGEGDQAGLARVEARGAAHPAAALRRLRPHDARGGLHPRRPGAPAGSVARGPWRRARPALLPRPPPPAPTPPLAPQHPGNIFVQEGAKVSLIDCGQVKQISTEYRLQLAEAILLVNEWQETGGSPKLIEAAQRKMDQFGVTFVEGAKPEAAAALALLLFGDPDAQMPGGFSNQELSADSPIKAIASFPQELVLLGRATILIKGIAKRLDIKWSLAAKWKKMAEQVRRAAPRGGRLGATLLPCTLLPCKPPRGGPWYYLVLTPRQTRCVRHAGFDMWRGGLSHADVVGAADDCAARRPGLAQRRAGVPGEPRGAPAIPRRAVCVQGLEQSPCEVDCRQRGARRAHQAPAFCPSPLPPPLPGVMRSLLSNTVSVTSRSQGAVIGAVVPTRVKTSAKKAAVRIAARVAERRS